MKHMTMKENKMGARVRVISARLDVPVGATGMITRPGRDELPLVKLDDGRVVVLSLKRLALIKPRAKRKPRQKSIKVGDRVRINATGGRQWGYPHGKGSEGTVLATDDVDVEYGNSYPIKVSFDKVISCRGEKCSPDVFSLRPQDVDVIPAPKSLNFIQAVQMLLDGKASFIRRKCWAPHHRIGIDARVLMWRIDNNLCPYMQSPYAIGADGVVATDWEVLP
jgi:hypothetical protein